jgi:hypothetical protein
MDPATGAQDDKGVILREAKRSRRIHFHTEAVPSMAAEWRKL